MSNKYSDQLMQALDIAIDEKISTLQFDKTIQATVQSVVDLDTGEYRVKYKDGIISVFAADPKETFKQGDAVYVTVPEGDFSNKKFISHRITNNSLSTGQYSELANTIFEISPNFSELGYSYIPYEEGQDSYSLIVGNDSSINILQSAPALANSRFKAYADQYEYIQISASFYNEFTTDHEVGDYGIQLVLTNLDDKQISYFLNLNDFNGDPYHLATWSPQSTVVKIPKGQIKALNAIYFYENGFISEGNKANLFMSGFSLNFVDKVDLTEVPYYLNILPLDGIAFTTSQTSLRLEGHIYHIGEELPETSCIFQWFERDLSVAPGDEVYDKRAGWGWKGIVASNLVSWEKIEGAKRYQLRRLNAAGDVEETFSAFSSDVVSYRDIGVSTNALEQYHYKLRYYNGSEWSAWSKAIEVEYVQEYFDKKTLVVSKEEISWQKSYKLIVVYNSTTLMTKEVTLINGSLESLDIEIEQVTSGNAIYLKLTKSGYTGDWYYLANDGNQIAIPQSPRSGTSPDIVPYLLYSPMTFYCQVYQGEVYQGELTYVMQNIESKDDVSVVFSGESLFSYDANGDINIYDAELERSLQAEIVWKKGIISSSPTIRWLDFENNVIGSSWVDYSNKDSMLKKVRVDTTENILYYTVKHKFKQTSSKNNSFRVEISTTDGQVYSFDKEIIFTKTGDPGTNGTRYQSLISIASDSPNKFINKSNNVKLDCKVYKDQNEFTISDDNITWEVYNLIVIAPQQNNQGKITGHNITIRGKDNNQKRYVKATIKITDEDKTTILYDFFPVNSCASQPNIDISELPKYIQYAANGRNPQFRKQVPIIKYNGKQATIESDDETVIKITNNQFKPIDEFDPDKPIGLLKVTVDGITIYHPVPMYINTFGNEAINGWDGVEVFLGNDQDHAIFAPQVGAGEKDTDNKFTGVIMGKDSAQKEGTKQLIGLYGYQQGETVFGLMENGKAFFGKAGQGRIEINGNDATIKGGGGGGSESGMTITLAKKDIDKDSEAIRIGNGNFIVNYGGKLTAKSAVIDGTITAGAGSVIGGWTLSNNRLSSGISSENNYVALDSGTENTNYFIWAGKIDPDNKNTKFKVTRSGEIIAVDADITGMIKATSGYIGGTSSGWNIISKAIFSGDSSFIIRKDSKYYTDQECTTGERTISQATEVASYTAITDTDKASFQFNDSTVTYYTLRSSFNSNYVRLQTNGTYAIFAGHIDGSSAPFSVTHGGALKAVNANITGTITATKGKIATWIISSSTLSSGTVYLYGGEDDSYKYNDDDYYRIWAGAKSPKSSQFFVTNKGFIKATNANITGTITTNSGTIGGWTINSSGLKKADNIFIYSNGSMNIRNNLTVDTSGNVTIKGDVTAKTGSIGRTFNTDGTILNSGWTISGTKLYASKVFNRIDKYVALSTQGNYAIYAGSDDIDDNDSDTDNKPSKAPFWVKFDGSLKATSATIEGKITANEGKIAGWAISGNKLQARTSATDTSGSTNLYLNGGPWDASDNNKYVLYMHSDSGTFSVNSSGVMSATGAVISGNITAKTGNIGGWSLSDSRLYASGTGRIGLSQSGIQVYDANGNAISGQKLVFWSGVKYTKTGNDTGNATGNESGLYLRGDNYFGVSSSGKLYCRGAEINGSITATAGTIGGWKITSNRLENSDGTVYLSASGGLHLGDTFSVSASGALSANGATISGNITASSGWIGNWQITNNRLQSSNGEVYLGTNGFKLTDKFKVDANGNVTLNGTITWGSSSKPWSSDIPVLPSYITSTKITSTTIESPTISGGNIYAANFYAVKTDPYKYLQITDTGIYYHTNTFGKWELTSSPASENASGWDEVQIVSPEAGMEIATYGPITLDTAQSINLTTSYRIKLDASQGVYIGSTSLAQYIEDHAGTAVFG